MAAGTPQWRQVVAVTEWEGFVYNGTWAGMLAPPFSRRLPVAHSMQVFVGKVFLTPSQ